MMEENKETPAPEMLDNQELEFRPWVKWCAVGGAGVLSLGLLVFTYIHSYNSGYELGLQEGDAQGFNRAISCNLVRENLSKAAEQNVLAFTRLYGASDDYLQRAAADTEKSLGWIKDAAVRMEAEWYLADALLQRQMSDPAIKILGPLVERAPHTSEWAYRVFRASTLLTQQQKYKEAERFYKTTIAFAGDADVSSLKNDALAHMVAADLGTSQNCDAAMEIWKKRYAELETMGDETKPLRSMLLVHMAEQHRSKAQLGEAEKLYRLALEGVDYTQVSKPEYAACYGTALLALGNTEAAEFVLRQAVSPSENQFLNISSHILALRQLAVIEQARGEHAVALMLLQRAQGVAEGRVQPTNSFWPCLFDQRGWLQYLEQNFQAALQDFTAALASTQEPLLMIQPLEGAARCHMELAQIDEALKLMQQALQLRIQHLPADKPSIGRLYLLLGQIYDQQGKDKEAEAAYGTAVTHMTGDSPVDVDNRRLALLGQAYALTELRRWQEAYEVWSKLKPLLADQPDRLEEAIWQMSRIKPYLPGETEPEVPAGPDETEDSEEVSQ